MNYCQVIKNEGDVGERAHLLVHLAADVVLLAIRAGRFEVLLIRRGKEPFIGELAIPGGFVERGETVDEAADREVREETSLWATDARLERFGVYSEPDRDPRKRVVSVAYVAMVTNPPEARAGGDAAAAQWMPVDQALRERLAFDHRRILKEAVEYARSELDYRASITGPHYGAS